MANIYYASVAPNKEAAAHGGLTEAIIKCIQNTDYHQIASGEYFISSIKQLFERALNKFDEDSGFTAPYIVETVNSISCRVELIYVSEPMYKHYYIRFEWL